ncbi:MAG: glycosyltransferase family 4 protein [Ilumatobacteraceae bacterium]
MRILVVCPHLRPDTAPTGVVMSGIVDQLAARGHEIHVVTALPWYRSHAIEAGWTGRLVRTARTAWGSITRVHPFPGGDRLDLLRRALGFLGFTALVALAGLRAGGWFRRVDAVLALSPPLTLGPTGWLLARLRRGRCVFNIQDVFPDAAVRTGAITNRRVIALAARLERSSYRLVDAVTVLSDDLAANVTAKIRPGATPVVVIPNFVDTSTIVPMDRLTPYREEFGLGDGPVVMYAGNLGFSQSLDLVVGFARRHPEVRVVINGDGAARPSLEEAAAEVPNLTIVGYQPADRLPEVLASADVHVVPLRAGLGDVSVPSKSYSILAAARPLVAAIDPGTAVTRLIDESGAGIAVPPDDADALDSAVMDLLGDPTRRARMGEAGRAWVVANASPAAVGEAYERLLGD